MIIHNVTQCSPEWFALRAKRMTASHAQEIGNAGKGLETYITKLMAEYFSTADKEHYSNGHTERGNELEPIARDMYELTTGNAVEQVGFVEYDEFSGASPDGLTEEGCIEIKCPDDVKYFKHLLDGPKAIDSSYIWQIQMQLLITNKKWCDYVAYNPNYKEPLFVHRVYPDYEVFTKLENGLEKGRRLILDIEDKVSRYKI